MMFGGEKRGDVERRLLSGRVCSKKKLDEGVKFILSLVVQTNLFFLEVLIANSMLSGIGLILHDLYYTNSLKFVYFIISQITSSKFHANYKPANKI